MKKKVFCQTKLISILKSTKYNVIKNKLFMTVKRPAKYHQKVKTQVKKKRL